LFFIAKVGEDSNSVFIKIALSLIIFLYLLYKSFVMELKNIELSEEHYRMLLKLLYLGKLMYTLNRDESCMDADPVEQLIFSFTKDFNSEDMVEFKEVTRQYFPTKKFQEEIYARVDYYDDEVFWNELIHRLAKRDMIEDMGKTKVNKMSKTDYIDKLFKYTLRYKDDFEKFGINRLEIDYDKKVKR
jgi:hypothetical protein